MLRQKARGNLGRGVAPRKYFGWISRFFKSFGSRFFFYAAQYFEKNAQSRIRNLAMQDVILFNTNPKLAWRKHKGRSRYPPGIWVIGVYELVLVFVYETFRAMGEGRGNHG